MIPSEGLIDTSILRLPNPSDVALCWLSCTFAQLGHQERVVVV